MHCLLIFFAVVAWAAAKPGYGYGLAPIPVSLSGLLLSGPESTGAILTGPSSSGAILTSKAISGSILASEPLLLPSLPITALLTKGGGTVAVSGAGAVVSGPKTVPVVVEGPSGKISADGLWGPTLEGLPLSYGKAYY